MDKINSTGRQVLFFQATRRGSHPYITVLSKQASKQEGLAKFFPFAWGVWGRRNKQIFDNVELTPKMVIERALALQSLQKECTKKTSQQLCTSYKWKLPPKGF